VIRIRTVFVSFVRLKGEATSCKGTIAITSPLVNEPGRFCQGFYTIYIWFIWLCIFFKYKYL